MPSIGPAEVFLLLVATGIPLGVPAYVVCSRRHVPLPGLAFIPLVGPWIAILRSIRVSALATLLAVIPLVSIVFSIWAAFAIPSRHGRSALWTVWFILPLLNIVGFWFYAFTLPRQA
jgi:hypothetical protein